MKTYTLAVALAAVGFVAALRAPAQSTPATSPTKALSHAIHAVDDLDTTLAFYRDVFGLNGTPQDFPNPAVPLLTNAPGVTLRLSMLALPGGMRFELTHFKGLERKPAQAKYSDPGAASLVLYVRDIETAVANAKKANAPIVTTGGAPVEIVTAKGKARSIILRDPDGFFLQLVQETPAPNAPQGNVHRVSLAYTMENADATRAFYTGKLGIELTGTPAYSKDAAMLQLVGARGHRVSQAFRHHARPHRRRHRVHRVPRCSAHQVPPPCSRPRRARHGDSGQR
jgi:catechol 2,3-dioxygenase-like lactoylglutathione lyase family enzyme